MLSNEKSNILYYAFKYKIIIITVFYLIKHKNTHALLIIIGNSELCGKNKTHQGAVF